MHMKSRRCLLGLVLLVLCFVCRTSDWIFASRLDAAFQSRVITIMALWAAVQRVCVVRVVFFYVGRPMNDANNSWRVMSPGLFGPHGDANARRVAVK